MNYPLLIVIIFLSLAMFSWFNYDLARKRQDIYLNPKLSPDKKYEIDKYNAVEKNHKIMQNYGISLVMCMTIVILTVVYMIAITK